MHITIIIIAQINTSVYMTYASIFLMLLVCKLMYNVNFQFDYFCQNPVTEYLSDRFLVSCYYRQKVNCRLRLYSWVVLHEKLDQPSSSVLHGFQPRFDQWSSGEKTKDFAYMHLNLTHLSGINKTCNLLLNRVDSTNFRSSTVASHNKRTSVLYFLPFLLHN